MEPIQIPIHIDDPKYFLIFSMEDFGILMGCMAVGILTHSMGYTLLGGFVVSYISSKFRGSIPDGRLLHMAYWRGFSFVRSHSLINPYARRFIG